MPDTTRPARRTRRAGELIVLRRPDLPGDVIAQIRQRADDVRIFEIDAALSPDKAVEAVRGVKRDAARRAAQGRIA